MPQDSASFQGDPRTRTVRYDPRRVIRYRAGRRHLPEIDVTICPHQLPATRHLLPYLPAAIHSIRIKLHPDDIRVESAVKDLNLECMCPFAACHAPFAEPEIRPVLFQSPPPIHDLPAHCALIGCPLAVGPGSRDVVLIGVLPHGSVGRETGRQPTHALTHAPDPSEGNAA